MKEGADVVKRIESLHVIVKDLNKVQVKHKYAYTILNENGKDFSEFEMFYDKFKSIDDISGTIYDAKGKVQKSLKKKDITDLPAYDGFSLVSDDRVKRFVASSMEYPYTIEVEVEYTYHSTFFMPAWDPVNDEKLSVQQSDFIVETPPGFQLRYKCYNYPVSPQIHESADGKTYSWRLFNLKPIELEDLAYTDNIYPRVFIAPVKFEIDGHTGDMSDWKGFGKFMYELYVGRDELPADLKAEVHRIADPQPTKEEKVKALYEFLQKNTRYVSIQLGIGGWQPFEAKFVAEKKYGDCKALSNFMVAMLKEEGIPAFCVLINGGNDGRGLIEDFSCHQFNHVISCVPNGKDTIWLECTSQTVSPGYMGKFTGNRNALLISPEGGFVVKTPGYSVSDNLSIRRAEAVVDADGNLQVEVRTHLSGIQQEQAHDLLLEENKEEREKFLNEVLSLPTYKVEKNEYSEIRGKIPAMDEFLQISSQNYAAVTGKRLFITPNIFNRHSRLINDKPRRMDIRLKYNWRDVDSIHIKIPDGYAPESVPKDLSLTNRFGKYSISYKVSGNQITLIRTDEEYAGKFPASEYTQFSDFYGAMNKADAARIVLVKN
jgi:hypothetical protein